MAPKFIELYLPYINVEVLNLNAAQMLCHELTAAHFASSAGVAFSRTNECNLRAISGPLHRGEYGNSFAP